MHVAYCAIFGVSNGRPVATGGGEGGLSPPGKI